MYLETNEEAAVSGVKLARGDCCIILGEIFKHIFYIVTELPLLVFCVCI